MSIDIHLTAGPADPDAARTPRSTPVTRVIIGSLVTGVVTALLLTLVVFPGAAEGIVTGSALLAFGLGWAMMGVLSVRHTSQPQRWTAVPAVAMTTTGVALLVTSPQDATLTSLSWVWPPVALVLVAWMFVQMRRALSGRGRWLLVPVLGVVALASMGAVLANVTLVRTENAYPAPGRTYSVGDHRLQLDCHGHGGPTVVLFSGLGEFSASWARITDDIRGTTRVCAYDRAGQGWSDDVDSPQDGVAAAADLHALLAAADEPGPYVLVGHSIGGPYALTYAAQYPDDVAGMVLLDSSSPRQLTDIADYSFQYAMMRRGLALLPTVARLGLGPVITPASHLPAEAGDRVHAMLSTARAERNGRDEISMIPVLFEQAQALTTLGDLPLAVLTTSESQHTGGWDAAQDRLAALSTDSLHRDVDSTHQGLVEDEHGSTESVRAIAAVVDAVRAGSPLATS